MQPKKTFFNGEEITIIGKRNLPYLKEYKIKFSGDRIAWIPYWAIDNMPKKASMKKTQRKYPRYFFDNAFKAVLSVSLVQNEIVIKNETVAILDISVEGICVLTKEFGSFMERSEIDVIFNYEHEVHKIPAMVCHTFQIDLCRKYGLEFQRPIPDLIGIFLERNLIQ